MAHNDVRAILFSHDGHQVVMAILKELCSIAVSGKFMTSLLSFSRRFGGRKLHESLKERAARAHERGWRRLLFGPVPRSSGSQQHSACGEQISAFFTYGPAVILAV